jgi:NAD(P) transhydrogenase subunit alpha
MVRGMQPGSVIVDLAVEAGGNVALSRRGEAVDIGGVIIIGFENVPGRLPADASSLYARNLFNFVSAFYDKENKKLAIDWEDQIIQGVALTRDGKIIHPNFVDAAPPQPQQAAPAENTAAQGDAEDTETTSADENAGGETSSKES